jgi:hypothetical protein
MDNGKNQTFPYSYKTISIPVNSQFVWYQPRLEIIQPENIYEVELLYTHFRILFDNALPADMKGVKRVTVTGLDDDGFIVREPLGMDINRMAVANVLDVNLDLTPFIYKEGRNEISFETMGGDFWALGTYTNILQIWKADMAYTVKGIY